MLTPATRSRTAVCTCSGVACPSSCTASRINWRCGVSRSPRSRSISASDVADTSQGYAPAVTLSVWPDELFGDGVFETVHLRPSGPFLLPAHLSRLARSAALLDLPAPDLPALATRRSDDPESTLRIIC